MAVYFDISPIENAAIVVHCDTGLPAHQDANNIDVRDLIHASLEDSAVNASGNEVTQSATHRKSLFPQCIEIAPRVS